MKQETIIIFTDGSSLGNPGPGGFGAVILFQKKNKVIEIGEYEASTTNNRMEITAAIEALLATKEENSETIIYTDSAYLLNGITSWVYGWEKNGWTTGTKEPVSNIDLWQKLLLEVRNRGKIGTIVWKKIKGHAGIIGNERADIIATSLADQNPIEFFHGTLDAYEKIIGGKLLDLNHTKTPKKKSSSSSKKAFSYLSLVGSKLMKHGTWTECEKRIKGVSGVKFKKALSKEDEENILREWGI